MGMERRAEQVYQLLSLYSVSYTHLELYKRQVSDKPRENAKALEPGLDDLYLYHFQDEAMERLSDQL